MDEELRELRKAAGLTQQQMSDIFKIPKRTIESWEGGKRTPPEYVKILVCEKLQRLITDTGNQN